MDLENFKNLINEAGFKTKKEFAECVKIHNVSVNRWGSSVEFPPYLNKMLEWAIKAKKYDEALKNGVSESLQNDESGVELEKLRLENMALRERLKDFEKFREALRAIM